MLEGMDAGKDWEGRKGIGGILGMGWGMRLNATDLLTIIEMCWHGRHKETGRNLLRRGRTKYRFPQEK